MILTILRPCTTEGTKGEREREGWGGQGSKDEVAEKWINVREDRGGRGPRGTA